MAANIEGLKPEAKRNLQILLARAKDEGIPVTLTSAFRSRDEQAELYRRFLAGDPGIPLAAKPGQSRHERGESADVSVPAAHRQRFNEMAKEYGFQWLGPKDKVHYDYVGAGKPSVAKPATKPRFASFVDEPAAVSQSAATGKPRFASFVGEPTNDAKPRFASFVDEPAMAKRDSKPMPKESVGSLMSSLTKGEHLAPQPQPAAVPSPFQPDLSDVPVPKGVTPKQKPGVLAQFTSLSNAYTGFLNQLGREGRKIPSITSDPAGHFAALPSSLKNAFATGVKAFGPDAVTPVHLREMFGAEKGKTSRGAYNTLAVLDYASSALTDPTNLVAGPASKVVGKALTPLTRPVARAAEGAKLAAALQKAERSREAAATTYGAAKAQGGGFATMAKHGAKLGAAGVAEAQAGAAVTAIPTRAGKVGARLAQTAPAKAALKVEQAAEAHLRQEATKATQVALKVIGIQKGALLSRPSTIAANTVGNVLAAEGELARHGLKMTVLAPTAKATKAEIDAFRKGLPVGDAAELELHAPGVLGTLANLSLGVAKSRNPLLEAQGYVDQVMKLSVYKALKPKLGPQAAAQRVKTALFDYSDRSELLKLLDRYGLWVFNGFPVAAAKSFIDTVVTRPDIIARYPRLQKQLLQEFPGSEQEYEKLKSYQKGPFVYPVGGGKFVDFGRFHPFGEGLGAIQAAQRFLSGEGGEASAPSEREMLSSTIYSSSLRAAREVPKGAGAKEAWKSYLFEELQNRVPAFRDIQRLRAAWAGEGMKDRPFDEPQSKAQAVGQALLGVSTARGELLGEKKERLAPAVDKRGLAADRYIGTLDQAIAAGKLKPPPMDMGLMNFDEAKRELQDTRKFLRTMLLSPKNLTAEGKWTTQGQARVKAAYLRLHALAALVEGAAPE